MKAVLKLFVGVVIALSINTNAIALGGFSSLSSAQQKIVNGIVSQLGIKSPDDKIKMRIYDEISYAFESNWNSYWLGLNELEASKYKEEKEKGVVEYVFNNESNGTLFFTFVYKPDVDQVIIFKRQIRHAGKSTILKLYEERKDDKKFKVIHETDSYGMLQEKGKVRYQVYHVGTATSSLVYYQQAVVNVD